MAFRVRILHFIFLGLIGMFLVIYSSYYATSGQYGVQDTVDVIAALDHHFPEGTLTNKKQDQLLPVLNTSLLPDLPVNDVAVPVVRKLTVIKKPTVHENVLVSKSNISTSSPSTPGLHLKMVSMAVLSENSVLNPKNVVFHVQKIPPKVSIPTDTAAAPSKSVAANIIPDSTEKGVTTRSIYQSGHSINNSGLCPDFGSQLQIMILITSAPNHQDARMAIRQTWGHYSQRSDINIAFFLGTTLDVKIHQAISDENALYGDLIYANFIDTYNNLTLKTVSMLEWVDIYCNRSKFIMKTDDDMFINVPVLLRFIEKHSKYEKTIFGRLAKKWKPIRIKKSKYYVSPQQYKPAVFPNFTTGPAYLMTGDAVKDLYWAALDKTYLKLEDVFVTGIVAQDVKVKRIHVNEFYNKRITFNPCNIQKGISIHMIKFHEQFDLWKKLLDGRSKCP